jgi:hypothetical protein
MRPVVLIAALAAAACDQPPVTEIAAAEQQVERARAVGAERYAPEPWKEAEAADPGPPATRGPDYHGALSAANDAAESARVAYVEPLLAELRTEVTPLPDLYRDARTQWEAKRPGVAAAPLPAARPASTSLVGGSATESRSARSRSARCRG